MKTRLTMRATLALGLLGAARAAGRYHRMTRAMLVQAGHEAGRGNVVTATVLLVLYLAVC